MKDILTKLKGGDRRSIGKAEEVVRAVLKSPKLFKAVFEQLQSGDPLVRMRAADVIEKVSRNHPEYLQPFKKRLIAEAAKATQAEVRWHVAQMFSYLKLTIRERERVALTLFSWINGEEKSRIVKVMSLQTLAELAKQEKHLKGKVLRTLRKALHGGSPAMRARSKKLLKELVVSKTD